MRKLEPCRFSMTLAISLGLAALLIESMEYATKEADTHSTHGALLLSLMFFVFLWIKTCLM